MDQYAKNVMDGMVDKTILDRESGLAIFICNAEICQSDDIHTYKQVIVINVAAINLYIMDKISTW